MRIFLVFIMLFSFTYCATSTQNSNSPQDKKITNVVISTPKALLSSPQDKKITNVVISTPKALLSSSENNNALGVGLRNGLLYYYSFDNNGNDLSGNNRNLHTFENTTYVPGKHNSAINFEQINTQLLLPSLRNSNTYSITLWVNLKSYETIIPNQIGCTFGTLAGQLTLDRCSKQLRYFFDFHSINADDHYSISFNSNNTIPLNKWTHIGITYNGNQVRLYINGLLDSYINTEYYGPNGKIIAFSPYGSIGGHSDYTILNGSIDEMSVHDRALSEDEIRFINNISDTPEYHLTSDCGGIGQRGCQVCEIPGWFWGCYSYSLDRKCDDGLDGGGPGNRICRRPCTSDEQYSLHQDRCVPRKAEIQTEVLTNKTLDISGVNNTPVVSGIKAKILNADKAHFFVPNGKSEKITSERFDNYIKEVCKGIQILEGTHCTSIKKLKREISSPLCEQIGMRKGSKKLDFPLFTLEDWNEKHKGGLKINANWFHIDGTDNISSRNFPYISPCTDISGPSMSNGEEISSATTPDVFIDETGEKQNFLDALVVTEDSSIPYEQVKREIKILRNSQYLSEPNKKFSVGGFIILENGRKISTNLIPKSNKSDKSGARTGVGISQDGKTLYIVVIQNGASFTGSLGGLTAGELASYLKDLGAYNAINLDNSGSSQFIYDKNDGSPIIKTLPGDKDPNSMDSFRPVPNYFEIRE